MKPDATSRNRKFEKVASSPTTHLEADKERGINTTQTAHACNNVCHCKADLDEVDNPSGQDRGTFKKTKAKLPTLPKISTPLSTTFFPETQIQCNVVPPGDRDDRDAGKDGCRERVPTLKPAEESVQPGSINKLWIREWELTTTCLPVLLN